MQNTGSQKLQLLSRNARQLLKVAQSTFPSATFDTEAFSDCNPDNLSGIDEIQCTWSQAHKLLSNQQFSDSEEAYPAIEQVLLRFSRATQEVMSSTASNYDMSRLVGGLLILALATSLLLPRIYHEFSQTVSTGIFLVFMVVGYGSMMFASSYVEEEQQFWYWICSGWMFYLHMRSESPQNSSRRKAGSSPFRLIKLATLGLIASHRVLRRWNQTGQKFTAEPDIARDFFPAHPVALWGLVILTYVDSGYHLLANMPASAPAKLIALITPALGFMFKLNFAANDSPELLADTPLSKLAGSWLGSLSLVLQARLVFGGLACCGLLAIVSAKASRSTQSKKRFHTVPAVISRN
jgi:ethanolaminephosphotransferase